MAFSKYWIKKIPRRFRGTPFYKGGGKNKGLGVIYLKSLIF